MKRTITVLQDDIDQGEPRQANRCPVARAMRRDLADLIDPDSVGYAVSVTMSYLYLNDMSVQTPAAVALFVHSYDCPDDAGALPAEPFKFEIEIGR